MIQRISGIRNRAEEYYRDHLKPAFEEHFRILAMIVSVALALRVVMALIQPATSDKREWIDFRLMAESGVISSFHPPLYILLLRGMMVSGGSTAVLIVQALAGTATVILTYYVANRIGGSKAGLLAASVSAVLPAGLRQVNSLDPSALLVLIAAAMMAAMVSRSGEKFRAVASAAAIGVGMMLEPVMVFFIPGILFALKKRSVFLVVLAAILFPWTVRNSVLERALVPVYRVEAFRVDSGGGPTDSSIGAWSHIDRLYRNVSLLTGRDWEAVRNENSEVKDSMILAAAYTWTIVILCGLFGLARRYRRSHRDLFLPFAIYTLSLILITAMSQRLRIPLQPLIVVYSAALFFKSPHHDKLAGGVEAALPHVSEVDP